MIVALVESLWSIRIETIEMTSCLSLSYDFPGNFTGNGRQKPTVLL